jgi:hypothetical protein
MMSLTISAPETSSLLSLVPADVGKLARPHLCVVIDTEEDFDWHGPFSRNNTSVESFKHLARAQDLFEGHGVRPCYLASYPVLMDDYAAETLRGWIGAGRAVIGAHLHPWVTPPHDEVVCLANSFPCNLPNDLERQKLQRLTDTALERLGQRPTVYKAGRYGFRVSRGAMLMDVGFEVDTSVLPFRDLSGAGGGPDFFECPSQPFWADDTRRLLHIPMTHGLIGPLRTLAGSGADRLLFSSRLRRMRLPGLMSHLGLLERIMLTPEGLTLDDMKRLVGKLASGGQLVFALTMHSPSFAPGHTPYARDMAEVDALLGRLDGFLKFFCDELGGVPVTPGELKSALI